MNSFHQIFGPLGPEHVDGSGEVTDDARLDLDAARLDLGPVGAGSAAGWGEGDPGQSTQDTEIRCPCGDTYTPRTEREHFAAVAHEWTDIPPHLRGLRDVPARPHRVLADDQIQDLHRVVNDAILAGDPLAGGTRRAIAAVLRWAGEQPALSDVSTVLTRWAQDVEVTLPTPMQRVGA